jgi:hypothetical protein
MARTTVRVKSYNYVLRISYSSNLNYTYYMYREDLNCNMQLLAALTIQADCLEKFCSNCIQEHFSKIYFKFYAKARGQSLVPPRASSTNVEVGPNQLGKLTSGCGGGPEIVRCGGNSKLLKCSRTMTKRSWSALCRLCVSLLRTMRLRLIPNQLGRSSTLV